MTDRNRILIVEDDEDQLQLYLQVFSRAGYEVASEQFAEDALERLASESFHLLLTDWYLPRMSGVRLIETVTEQYPRMKTLLMSSYDTVHRVAAECGASGAYRKTESLARMTALVAELLSKPATVEE